MVHATASASALPITRDAAWFVAHFGQADALEAEMAAFYAEAERLTLAARQAGRDMVAVNSVTEIADGFPLAVKATKNGTYDQVEVRSPVNNLVGQAYLSQAPRHSRSWCVNIMDHAFSGPRKTGSGGDWLGDGWTKEGAIAAAKSWVATGERPTRS
jgi:hypothetical protein